MAVRRLSGVIRRGVWTRLAARNGVRALPLCRTYNNQSAIIIGEALVGLAFLKRLMHGIQRAGQIATIGDVADESQIGHPVFHCPDSRHPLGVLQFVGLFGHQAWHRPRMIVPEIVARSLHPADDIFSRLMPAQQTGRCGRQFAGAAGGVQNCRGGRPCRPPGYAKKPAATPAAAGSSHQPKIKPASATRRARR